MGAWRSLTPKAKAVFGVLVAYQHNIEHHCILPLPLLSEKSGITKSSISQTTSELQASGLITKEKIGREIKYCVLFKPEEWVTQAGGFPDPKARRRLTATRIVSRDNHGRFHATISDAYDSENVGAL
jgi:hypothetical protein